MRKRVVTSTYDHLRSSIQRKENDMRRLLSVGPFVLDLSFLFRGVRDPYTAGSKTDCESFDLSVGGCAVNLTRANALLAEEAPRVCGIVGNDPIAWLAKTLAEAEFGDCCLIRTTERTRLSAIVPSPSGNGAQHVFTHRSPIADAVATAEQIERQIRREDIAQVAIGSFTDIDGPIVQRCIAVAREEGKTIYIMPSRNQLHDVAGFAATVAGLSQADWLQLNIHDLRDSTGREQVFAAVHYLQQLGVRASFLVTAARDGLHCLSSELREWYYQRAFAVQPVNDVGAGDSVAGTFLACLARLSTNRSGIKAALRYAAAAAAFTVSAKAREGGWRELERVWRTPLVMPARQERPASVAKRRNANLVGPVSAFLAGACTTSAAMILAQILGS
jgi:sugar/nucleoside kinase (ribokinase family)